MAMAISKGIPVLLFLVHFQYLLLPMQAHQCQGHDHDHDHHHHHHHQHFPVTLEHHNHAHHDHAHHGHRESSSEHEFSRRVLPEEIAEEEELRLMAGEYSPLHYDHDHDHHHHIELSGAGLWLRAMGCSLLVSTASLVCLILLPLFLFQGKPSKVFVDALAAFGAGAMLGDAFLHQLPHALGGSGHKHDHSSHADIHSLGDTHGVEGHGHSHSIEDLSVGLAVLVGIILFFIVEKIVREVEDLSARRGLQLVHGHHHHHHHKRNQQSELSQNPIESESADDKDGTEDSMLIGKNKDVICEEASNPENSGLRKRLKQTEDEIEFKQVGDGKENKKVDEMEESEQIPDKKTAVECAGDSNLVLGYLNLFSDGVHNFTDGMALGSAFLLHGTVGGWSRTLFLLAHEIPQEVGDFGILVRSGFTVFKALAFNFLSALVALAGTALALSIGRDPGHSSLIEGFTAGGFIYIAVAGVLPEMHQTRMSVGNTVLQLLSLCLGISVALSISLLE